MQDDVATLQVTVVKTTECSNGGHLLLLKEEKKRESNGKTVTHSSLYKYFLEDEECPYEVNEDLSFSKKEIEIFHIVPLKRD